MAVPIEFCTAIFLKEQLSARFPGGLDALFAFCDSATYLEDEQLVRISFVATSDALALVDRIVERVGTDAEPLVFAIVDHSVTPENLPPWLTVGDIDGTHCAWISGTPPGSFTNSAEQRLGQLRAELAYTHADDIIAGGLHEFIDSLQIGLNAAGDAIRETFFEVQPALAAAAAP